MELTFGETIKRLREEANLPLREVASALGIDISMLARIEKDERRPTKEFITKASQYYKVSDRELTIAFLSDAVAYQIKGDEHYFSEIFEVAERKIEYSISKRADR